jgi:hypothetical protein
MYRATTQPQGRAGPEVTPPHEGGKAKQAESVADAEYVDVSEKKTA